MPFPVAAAVIGGAQLLGQGINAVSQGNTNKRTRRHQIYMYDRQRADSLADWNMMNEYNDPAAQMARLRNAGLNPNLVYGNGSVASDASMPRSSDTGSWNPQAPEVDLGSVAGSAFQAHFDAQIKEQQIDNLKAQEENIKADTLVKLSGNDVNNADVAKKWFDLHLDTDLRDISLETRKMMLRKLTFDTDRAGNEANIAATNAATALAIQPDVIELKSQEVARGKLSLQQAALDILGKELQNENSQYSNKQIQEAIENLKQDTRLKRIEADWKSGGFSSQSATELLKAILGRLLSK